MAKGKKTGGRRKGVPNRSTLERQAAMEASGLLPLDYMLSVLRDPKQDYDVRLEAAKSAAPYVHPRLANIELSGNKDKPLEVRVVRYSDRATQPVGATGVSDAGLGSLGTGNAPRSPVLAQKVGQG